MNVIITAAGEGSRWGQHMGVPKHLLPVDGETLLGRTVRLVRGIAAPDTTIYVSGPDDPRYRIHSAALFTPQDRTDYRECSMYQWTRWLWSDVGKTVYLYGDTYYTPEAIATILGFAPREWHLFARFKHSTVTGKPWPEVWAHSFWTEHQVLEQELMDDVVARKIPRASIYEMYKLLHGKLLPFNYDQHDYGRLTQIDDWTEDFDFPKDYDNFIERRKRVGG